jgi:hypothetical protein
VEATGTVDKLQEARHSLVRQISSVSPKSLFKKLEQLQQICSAD